MLLGEVRMRLTCKHCAIKERAANTGPRPSPWLARVARLTRWIVPSAILVLLPKCPLCIAGYVMLATGIGISFTAAVYLQAGFTVLCVASLLYLVVKCGMRFNAELRNARRGTKPMLQTPRRRIHDGLQLLHRYGTFV